MSGNVLLGGGLRTLCFSSLWSDSTLFLNMHGGTDQLWLHCCFLKQLLHKRLSSGTYEEDRTITKVHFNHFRHTSAATAMFYTGSSNSFPSVWRSSWPSTIKDWANDWVCSTWRWLNTHWRQPVVQDCLTRSAAAKANRDATSNPWRLGIGLLREGRNWNWHSEAGWVAPKERRGEGLKAQCILCQVLSALQRHSWDRNETDKSAVCSQFS